MEIPEQKSMSEIKSHHLRLTGECSPQKKESVNLQKLTEIF